MVNRLIKVIQCNHTMNRSKTITTQDNKHNKQIKQQNKRTQQTQSHKHNTTNIQSIHNNTIHINISLMNTTHTTTITYQYITNHVSLTHTTNR
mgnify:CR=1 FL=1